MCRMNIFWYGCSHIVANYDACPFHTARGWHQELPATATYDERTCDLCSLKPTLKIKEMQSLLFTVSHLEDILDKSGHDSDFMQSVIGFYSRGYHKHWGQPGYDRKVYLKEDPYLAGMKRESSWCTFGNKEKFHHMKGLDFDIAFFLLRKLDPNDRSWLDIPKGNKDRIFTPPSGPFYYSGGLAKLFSPAPKVEGREIPSQYMAWEIQQETQSQRQNAPGEVEFDLSHSATAMVNNMDNNKAHGQGESSIQNLSSLNTSIYHTQDQNHGQIQTDTSSFTPINMDDAHIYQATQHAPQFSNSLAGMVDGPSEMRIELPPNEFTRLANNSLANNRLLITNNLQPGQDELNSTERSHNPFEEPRSSHRHHAGGMDPSNCLCFDCMATVDPHTASMLQRYIQHQAEADAALFTIADLPEENSNARSDIATDGEAHALNGNGLTATMEQAGIPSTDNLANSSLNQDIFNVYQNISKLPVPESVNSFASNCATFSTSQVAGTNIRNSTSDGSTETYSLPDWTHNPPFAYVDPNEVILSNDLSANGTSAAQDGITTSGKHQTNGAAAWKVGNGPTYLSFYDRDFLEEDFYFMSEWAIEAIKALDPKLFR